jgi:hypothetical protein
MLNQNRKDQAKHLKMKTLSALDFFAPSAFNLVLYITIFIITILISQPSQYKNDLQNFHLTEFQGSILYTAIHDSSKFISTGLANSVAIYIFWVVIAIFVYLVANRLTQNVEELAHDVSLKQYIWPQGSDRNGPLKEFFEKLVFRFVMLVALIVYIFKLVPLIDNFWKHKNIGLSFSVHSISAFGLVLLYELLFLHFGVILLRLFFIKRRLINI